MKIFIWTLLYTFLSLLDKLLQTLNYSFHIHFSYFSIEMTLEVFTSWIQMVICTRNYAMYVSVIFYLEIVLFGDKTFEVFRNKIPLSVWTPWYKQIHYFDNSSDQMFQCHPIQFHHKLVFRNFEYCFKKMSSNKKKPNKLWAQILK